MTVESRVGQVCLTVEILPDHGIGSQQQCIRNIVSLRESLELNPHLQFLPRLTSIKPF